MLYDYLITQFYPNIRHYVMFLILFPIVCSLIIWIVHESNNKRFATAVKRAIFVNISQYVMSFILLWVLALLPDKEYIQHFYGDARPITSEQKEALQKAYNQHYEASKQLLLECLEKAQKQPQRTVTNDTNEVTKTCYDVAKYKF